MDPLTALGLAANIIQFVDFASKLLSTGQELYQSGASAPNLELSLVADDVLLLCTKLKNSSAPYSRPANLTDDDQVCLLRTCIWESYF